MIRILVVGQTPPPYGGQALMINYLVNGIFTKIQIYHIRMSYSSSFKSIGRFKLGKLFHLFKITIQTIWYKYKYNINVLYYPPAGPNIIPVIRDICFLFVTRLFFKKIIFHFRAAGVSEFLESHSKLIRSVAKIAYGNPEGAIQLSSLNPSDGDYLGANNTYVIPNGLEDAAISYLPIKRENPHFPKILYIGILQETKGIMVLLIAAKILKINKLNFQIAFMGEFSSKTFEKEVMLFVEQNNMKEIIKFIGVKIGRNKYKELVDADIFCFPSYFESESFGNVLLEAMMFELPIVATQWRGIPDIVVDNESGFLVAIKKPTELADKLEMLITNYELRQKMGKRGRELFSKYFTLEKHLSRMEDTLFEIATLN